MIKQLTYSVTFGSNQVCLAADLTLEPGSTSVTGPNGSGKTFGTIEMVRWLLFGTKALRGPAKDYKTLKGRGVIAIAGADYTIERSIKKSTLKNEAGEILAVNPEAVNQKVIEILGYGLDVFDVVNAARQKDTDRISKLRPAARKKMIDDIIGLGAQEMVEKDCRTEATNHRRIAEALEDQWVNPTPPSMPIGYRPSEKIQAELDKVKAYQKEKLALEAKIVDVGDAPTEPTVPVPEDVLIQTLEKEQAQYLQDVSNISSLDRSISSVGSSTAKIEVVEASEEYRRLKALDEARGPKAEYTEEQLDQMQQTWAVRQSLTEIGEKEVTCPECNHKFCPSHEAPPAPKLDNREIKAQSERLRKWETHVPKYSKPDPYYPEDLCKAHRRYLEQQPQVEKWKEQLEELESTLGVDVSEEIEHLKEIKRQWTTYGERLTDHNRRVERVKYVKEVLAALEVVEGDENALSTAVVEARVYEGALDAYITQKISSDGGALKIKETRKKADDFGAGATALAEARAEVKAYLAPSLSRVASALIHEMTNGKLSSVDVTEDMEIYVDGQEIGTLSGAGATVANLALRIGLGQMLVAKVFPVFIGDELDSDMDADRAAATTECLTNLKDRLSQTILITHKQINSTDQAIIFP